MLILLKTILIANLYLLHPFHASITEIHFENKHLKISVKIFLDDLEKTLIKQTGNTSLDITKKEHQNFVNENLKKYLQKNLILKLDNKLITLNYLGSESDVDVMWCYLEVENLSSFKNIEIQNTILLETFSDQENIVHITSNDNNKSLRFSKKSTVHKILFQR